MLSIRIDRIAYQIVEDILLGNGRENEALYLNFDVRLSYYDNGRTYDQSRGLHLLYHVLPGMRYVNVFSGVTRSPFGKLSEVRKELKHEVSHDSCWRDVRIFSDTYFEMANCINEERKKQGLSEVAPKDMSEHNSFRQKLFEWVPVKVSKDPNDSHNYRKLVKLL